MKLRPARSENRIRNGRGLDFGKTSCMSPTTATSLPSAELVGSDRDPPTRRSRRLHLLRCRFSTCDSPPFTKERMPAARESPGRAQRARRWLRKVPKGIGERFSGVAMGHSHRKREPRRTVEREGLALPVPRYGYRWRVSSSVRRTGTVDVRTGSRARVQSIGVGVYWPRSRISHSRERVLAG